MPKVDRLNRKRELQRVRRAQLNPEDRTHGQIIDSERRRGARTNPEVRQPEQLIDTLRRRGERTNPEVRQHEQVNDKSVSVRLSVCLSV